MIARADPVFRAHYNGAESVDRAGEAPLSAFDVAKRACTDPSHGSCGDCLKALWNHGALFGKPAGGGCALCRMMQLTIFMRRGLNVRASFAEFDALLRANLDHVVRTVDARHLVSFATNYAEHSADAAERGAAATLSVYNMMEKVAVSRRPSPGVLPKTTDAPGIPDATFVQEASYGSPVTNFTMYDWKRGDAMGRCVDIVLGAHRESAVARRLLASCLAWSMLYGESTLVGTLAAKAGESRWRKRVVRAYLYPDAI